MEEEKCIEDGVVTSVGKSFDSTGLISISPQAVTDLFPARAPSLPRPTRESVLRRLSEALLGRTLRKIDLSQRGLLPSDSRLVKMALLQNGQLTILQLGYNMLGDTGAQILAPAIGNLESLDLGFNSVGDVGCAAIACTPSRLQTLYLAGNRIGQEGALALADQIPKHHNRLRSLYLAGNDIGSDGVEAISNAIVESESNRSEHTMRELYLGAGMVGCHAVAPLLQSTTRMLVLSLPNCDIKDDSLAFLCSSIQANDGGLTLESLQLSFNKITCSGIQNLVNALVSGRGKCPLRELLLDNNEIADRGIHHISSKLIPYARSLETLDVGFNRIETNGIKVLTKALDEYGTVKKLSVSGNSIDTASAAKAISFFLACSPSLESIALVRCFVSIDAKRHVAAGVVSNPGTRLKTFSGFSLGQIVPTLGFPTMMEKWGNRQILDFIHIMWKNHYRNMDHSECIEGSLEEEEKFADPIHYLPPCQPRAAPIEATVVIEAAKKTFSSLAANGLDLFTRQSVKTTTDSPIVSDSMIIEYSTDDCAESEANSSRDPTRPNKVASFVAPPEMAESDQDDPSRRKWLEEWVIENTKVLEKFSELKFNASELWRLHQHFFTPVVNVSGGHTPSTTSSSSSAISSVPEGSDSSVEDVTAGSQPIMSTKDPKAEQATQGSSLPILKRKVSYSCLAGAAMSPVARPAVSLEIPSMPPKNKRARRNRTRISFLPRIQAKLNSYLDVSHEKSLILMRRLLFCEQSWGVTHLSGPLARDAETILLDLM